MYKLQKYNDEIVGVYKQDKTLTLCIPFDPANTDYQTFKKEINKGTAQLEDADGNLMTEQQAKDFVLTLP